MQWISQLQLAVTSAAKYYKEELLLQKQNVAAGHDQVCCPFRIETDPDHPEIGRFVVANRDLQPGDVIIEEPPVTAGPKQVRIPDHELLTCFK